MQQLIDAYTGHANLKAGKIKIYNVDKIPSATEVMRGMPCVVPVFGEASGTPGFELEAISEGQGDCAWTVTFLLITQKPQMDRPQGVPLSLLTAYGQYYDAVRADPDLGDALDYNTIITKVQFRPDWEWGGEVWVGAKITHTWGFITQD
jgi:hypothetical protein